MKIWGRGRPQFSYLYNGNPLYFTRPRACSYGPAKHDSPLRRANVFCDHMAGFIPPTGMKLVNVAFSFCSYAHQAWVSVKNGTETAGTESGNRRKRKSCVKLFTCLKVICFKGTQQPKHEHAR